MNAWPPLTPTTTDATFHDGDGIYDNRQKNPNFESFTGPQDIETEVRELNAAIAATEQELMAIEGSHSGKTAELNHLKTRLKHLSVDPRRLLGTSNPSGRHSSW